MIWAPTTVLEIWQIAAKFSHSPKKYTSLAASRTNLIKYPPPLAKHCYITRFLEVAPNILISHVCVLNLATPGPGKKTSLEVYIEFVSHTVAFLVTFQISS